MIKNGEINLFHFYNHISSLLMSTTLSTRTMFRIKSHNPQLKS